MGLGDKTAADPTEVVSPLRRIFALPPFGGDLENCRQSSLRRAEKRSGESGVEPRTEERSVYHSCDATGPPLGSQAFDTTPGG